MKYLFNLVFYQPLYNALVFLGGVMPGHNLALAIVVLTIGVKTILLPLQRQMTRTQLVLKTINPELQKIKEQYAKDSTAQARETLALYKKYKINPFSGFLLIILQIPILFALLFLFRSDFHFDPQLLYSFIHIPPVVNTSLFGWLDITGKSYVLAIVVALTQFFQNKLMAPPPPPPRAGEPSWQTDFAKSFNFQIRYFFPILIGFVAISLPAAVSLYWTVSNLYSIAQETWFRRSFKTPPLS
jgi:YidC/Oxa1 family membrane protein insertase